MSLGENQLSTSYWYTLREDGKHPRERILEALARPPPIKKIKRDLSYDPGSQLQIARSSLFLPQASLISTTPAPLRKPISEPAFLFKDLDFRRKDSSWILKKMKFGDQMQTAAGYNVGEIISHQSTFGDRFFQDPKDKGAPETHLDRKRIPNKSLSKRDTAWVTAAQALINWSPAAALQVTDQNQAPTSLDKLVYAGTTNLRWHVLTTYMPTARVLDRQLEGVEEGVGYALYEQLVDEGLESSMYDISKMKSLVSIYNNFLRELQAGRVVLRTDALLAWLMLPRPPKALATPTMNNVLKQLQDRFMRPPEAIAQVGAVSVPQKAFDVLPQEVQPIVGMEEKEQPDQPIQPVNAPPTRGHSTKAPPIQPDDLPTEVIDLPEDHTEEELAQSFNMRDILHEYFDGPEPEDGHDNMELDKNPLHTYILDHIQRYSLQGMTDQNDPRWTQRMREFIVGSGKEWAFMGQREVKLHPSVTTSFPQTSDGFHQLKAMFEVTLSDHVPVPLHPYISPEVRNYIRAERQKVATGDKGAKPYLAEIYGLGPHSVPSIGRVSIDRKKTESYIRTIAHVDPTTQGYKNNVARYGEVIKEIYLSIARAARLEGAEDFETPEQREEAKVADASREEILAYSKDMYGGQPGLYVEMSTAFNRPEDLYDHGAPFMITLYEKHGWAKDRIAKVFLGAEGQEEFLQWLHAHAHDAQETFDEVGDVDLPVRRKLDTGTFPKSASQKMKRDIGKSFSKAKDAAAVGAAFSYWLRIFLQSPDMPVEQLQNGLFKLLRLYKVSIGKFK